MIHCALFVTVQGLEAHGGVGDLMPFESPIRSISIFIGKILIEMTYFIIITVFLVNIVLGVIIEAFRELRIRYQMNMKDKTSICFICGVTRDELEKNNEKFEHHVSEVHNLRNYIDYIVSLKRQNPQNLNSINSAIYNEIEEKSIAWFPTPAKTEEETEENMSSDEE